ncbi:hypothetical protein [Aneurinibacillus tyrosinisolvens]|uniref:hypothetical protein n=1 Tax=Aneurinibacillus tyrosinisolvens TaxID=1443435 RepID=UPI00063F5A00|nr:hypothetical protein [Aneurinibacillus tyrosinisolvens]
MKDLTEFAGIVEVVCDGDRPIGRKVVTIAEMAHGFTIGSLNQQEVNVVECCSGCGDDIQEGAEVWETDGEIIHRRGNCAEGYLAQMGLQITV